jgi:hypothetical protein
LAHDIFASHRWVLRFFQQRLWGRSEALFRECRLCSVDFKSEQPARLLQGDAQGMTPAVSDVYS